jgi:hypothetical protein
MRFVLLIWFLVSVLKGIGQQYIAVEYYSCDLNRDGINDLILTEQTSDDLGKNGYGDLRFRTFSIKAYLGSMQGLASAPVWQLSGGDSIRNLSDFNLDFDLNQDGIADLLAVGEIMGTHEKKAKRFIVVFYGSGNGILSSAHIMRQIAIPERKTTEYHFFDYNGDGFADLIVLSHGENDFSGQRMNVNFKTQIMYGSQQGFSPLETLELPARGFYSFSCEDYDGDKHKDILIEYPGKGGYKGELLSGQPNNKPQIKEWSLFSHHSSLFTFVSFGFYFAGDVNGDGFNDEAVFRITEGNEKYRQAPPYTIVLYPGSLNGLQRDTLLYHSFSPLKFYKQGLYLHLTVTAMGDFDGDGSSDLLIRHREYFPQFNRGLLEPPNDFFKVNCIIWGGKPPTYDSAGSASLADFLHFNELQIIGIGDVNGDKIDDLLLYNNKKQFVIYGNRERKFSPVEWKH